jgi:hypothetical protein
MPASKFNRPASIEDVLTRCDRGNASIERNVTSPPSTSSRALSVLPVASSQPTRLPTVLNLAVSSSPGAPSGDQLLPSVNGDSEGSPIHVLVTCPQALCVVNARTTTTELHANNFDVKRAFDDLFNTQMFSTDTDFLVARSFDDTGNNGRGIILKTDSNEQSKSAKSLGVILTIAQIDVAYQVHFTYRASTPIKCPACRWRGTP